MSMYIGNLNYRVKEGDLKKVLADYGNKFPSKLQKTMKRANQEASGSLKWRILLRNIG